MMRVEEMVWTAPAGWSKPPALQDAGLVLYFAGRDALKNKNYYEELKGFYPTAHIMGCSTGGEIYGAEVLDESVVAVAVRFSKTRLKAVSVQIDEKEASFAMGQQFAQQLNDAELSNIFLLSDSTHVNGSELIRGMYSVLDKSIIVTGGLAGDGAAFVDTVVGLDAPPEQRIVAGVGFYGAALKVSYGSVGGWSPFGPKRTITKSQGNVLYELDGKPALALYKEYLGEQAYDLPKSGLLFPLSIRPDVDSKHDIVRTMMAVNEADQSVTFADEVPMGYIAQLMRGDFDLLVDGAIKAAELAYSNQAEHSLAVLVSCIGRKLLLGQAISDETEAVADIFKHAIPTIGFYSNGEICHAQFTDKCCLHNQTMTVTIFHEV